MELSMCPGNRSNAADLWDVRGFYDDKFNDPMNFNLGENTVSILTAITTSFSLLLFVDIIFRVSVRAKNGEVSKRVVLRRHIVDNCSNPITLCATVLRGIRTKRPWNRNQAFGPQLTSGKWTYASLVVLGFVAVCMEFIFIFLSTGQKKVFDVHLGTVPVFEFKDRGCESVFPVPINTCNNMGGIAEKAGFESRAYIQACTGYSASLLKTGGKFGESGEAFISLIINRVVGITATLRDDATVFDMYNKVGVVMMDNGAFFSAMTNQGEEEVANVVSSRLNRANVTVRTWEIVNISSPTSTVDGGRNMALLFLLDISKLDVTGTSLWNAPGVSDGPWNDPHRVMPVFLMGAINSVIVPSGQARGEYSNEDRFFYLDMIEDPLAYYTRPRMGVVPSLIICGVLVVVWIVAVALGMEDGVDSRWAWKEFFSDTHHVEDFARGNDESKELGWRFDNDGTEIFGFMLRT
ncbi:hypothetical protein BWQ96_10530 [Gracilariopsis chorda]|uniref:Uncharacterized protein n=1 Tax=Gracilariopsis chorda TaxID=448386 RepID=A0A2V3ICE5_9FLOR|nr:hypothetical protein BWQ96_10530 [Gracilariopsis chorda]|eukprot:PXF39764.1 hypothetical protein BWQ96_10530 [Gracilariopsis chorda]